MKMPVLRILALALLVSPAMAASTLTFTLSGPGKIAYAGGVKPLIGTNIKVGTVSDGVSTFNLIGGKLNFTTGNFTTFIPGTSWVFSGGPSTTISLTATCIDSDHDGGACDGSDTTPSGALLSGFFSGPDPTVNVGALNSRVSLAAFVDTKDPNLLALFGIPPSTFAGQFTINFLNGAVPPNAFTSTTIRPGTLTNLTPLISEPASLALLGCGLLGLGLFARKKLRVQ